MKFPPLLIFAVGIGLAVVLVFTCAVVSKPWGVGLGWILQLVLILSGVVEPTMYVVGALFALSWWYGIRTGIRIDREAAQREREQAAWDAAHPAGSQPETGAQKPVDLSRTPPQHIGAAVSIERTLVLIKPDGVARNLTGSILGRIEAKGYTLAELKKVHASRELLEQHYEEHVGKPFYEPLVEFMLSGPVVAAIFEGHRVIEGFRSLAGTTDPTTAAPGTIRGDFGRDWGLAVQQNLVHGSDSVESAGREIKIWF